MKKILILLLLLPFVGYGQGTKVLRVGTVKADTFYLYKPSPLPAAGYALTWDSVSGKMGYRTFPAGGGVDSIWRITGVNIEKQDSALQLNIVQQADGDNSTLFADNSMMQLSVTDYDFRTPEDSLVNDSTSKGQVEVESKAPGAGFGAGYYLSAASGINLMYMASEGKQSMFGLDDAYKGAVIGSYDGWALNIGTKTKRFGTGWFTQIAASSISNPSWPPFPNAIIDGRASNGTAIFGGAGYQGTGVYGYQTGQYGQGVWGYSDLNYGVRAGTADGRAIHALATGTGSGVESYTESGTALRAKSNTGVQFWFGKDSGYHAMVMDANGNVGIGTTAPTYKLHVDAGVAQAGYFKSTASYGVQGTSTNYPGVYGLSTNSYGVSGASTSSLGVYGYSSTGVAGKFTTTSGYAGIFTGGNVGIGTTSPATALDVNGVITATGGTSTDWNAKIGGSLTSGYIPYATAATTVGNSGMYWDNANGRVGIGTSAPGGAIDAVSSSFPVGSFIRTTSLTSASDWNGFDGIASGYSLRTKTSGNMGDGFGGGMVFSIQDATSAAAYTDGVTGRIYTRRDGSDTKGAMQFYTTGENASTATMTLRNSGNVGINTTSPISTLHVAGSARVTDSIKAQQTVWMPGLPDKAATGELYRNGTTGEISYHSRVSRHTPSGDSIPTSALAPVIFLDPAGNITFNDANYGGVMEGLHDGQIVRIINLSGTYTTTFKQSAYVLDEGGSDITLGENESITIVWGAEETKWIIIGISPSL